MKKYQVITLSKVVGFKSMKEELTKDVNHFLNVKSNEGYEIINVSFTYLEGRELIAFITICK